MIKQEVEIKDEFGLHGRVAEELLRAVRLSNCKVRISNGKKESNCRGIFSILSLDAVCGDILTVEADGKDEEDIISALIKILSKNTYKVTAA